MFVKTLTLASLFAALGAAAADLDMDPMKWVGYLAAAGLALLSLYSRYRDIVREKNQKDYESEAKQRETHRKECEGKLELALDENGGLRSQLTAARDQVKAIQEESERWKALYQRLRSSRRSKEET
jgi:hypothetical protein